MHNGQPTTCTTSPSSSWCMPCTCPWRRDSLQHVSHSREPWSRMRMVDDGSLQFAQRLVSVSMYTSIGSSGQMSRGAGKVGVLRGTCSPSTCTRASRPPSPPAVRQLATRLPPPACTPARLAAPLASPSATASPSIGAIVSDCLGGAGAGVRRQRARFACFIFDFR